MQKLFYLFVVTAITFLGSGIWANESKNKSKSQEDKKVLFKLVDIPRREHGYSNFESLVISSSDSMKAFLEQVPEQKGWNAAADFLQVLQGISMDFKTHSLVLLRHTEGSGGVSIDFNILALVDRRLQCRIARKIPEMGTADMAYYCFGLIVRKDAVSKIVVDLEQGPTSVVQVK
jgi:hypothetical protein